MLENHTATDKRLKVFISSKMQEFRDVREIVEKALEERGINAWVYEEHAGARPGSVEETSLNEVEATEIYVGLFGQKYGLVTAEEFMYARALAKPCFVYIRDKEISRESRLEQFLATEVCDLTKGVTYAYFDSAIELGRQIADDIMAWLIRSHREMTAEINEAKMSRTEIERLRREVTRLQSVSRRPLPEGTVIDVLSHNLRNWFVTLGYGFEDYQITGNGFFEWILDVPARRGYDRIVVRGVEGEAECQDVLALRDSVDASKANEGWLVSARRKSEAAIVETSKPEHQRLYCYTLDELLDESADFSGYLQWLEDEIKRRKIDVMYIPLGCKKDELDAKTQRKVAESEYRENAGWIDGYIDRWLDDPSKEHISVLGEFGTGKTWFALHYAWTAMQRYNAAKARGTERPRLPLVIPLRDYAKAVSVESLFSEFFFRKHEIPLPGYSAFEQLNRMGKLLLIFDGFDEMAAKVDRQQMINNFWELARVVVPGAKAILTCRTEHFPEAREGRALLNAELRASTAALTGRPPQFEVLELKKLDDSQIRMALSFRTSEKTVDQIMKNRELLDLARRPVMMEYILEALPDIDAGKPVDMSRVYLYAIKRKMERDFKEERSFTSLADKLYFLSELSWEMLSTNQMSINYRLFPSKLRLLFGDVVHEQKELDHWHYDMMGQTLLTRNAEGDYTPAHRSLLEFFVAYKFGAELGLLARDFTELAENQSHVDSGREAVDYQWATYFKREFSENGDLITIAPLRRFLGESPEDLTNTFGQMPISFAIVQLMRNMVAEDTTQVRGRLSRLIEWTRGKPSEETLFIGGNSVSLATRIDRGLLTGRDFSGTNLRNAIWVGNLTDCDLRNADLSNCTLESARMLNAQLQDSYLAGVNLGFRGWYVAAGEYKFLYPLSYGIGLNDDFPARLLPEVPDEHILVVYTAGKDIVWSRLIQTRYVLTLEKHANGIQILTIEGDSLNLSVTNGDDIDVIDESLTKTWLHSNLMGAKGLTERDLYIVQTLGAENVPPTSYDPSDDDYWRHGGEHDDSGEDQD
jgi:hypothetical protein